MSIQLLVLYLCIIKNENAMENFTDDKGQLKVGDKVIEFKRPTPNQEKREYKTKGEIILIVGAMAKVIFEPNNLEEWVAIIDLKKI